MGSEQFPFFIEFGNLTLTVCAQNQVDSAVRHQIVEKLINKKFILRFETDRLYC